MITIEDIIADSPEMIYYSVHSCWWTHLPEDLGTISNGIPCDPLGSVPFRTDNIMGFLATAQEKADHYGKHGIQAFLAAHHSTGIGPFAGWEQYNQHLDLTELGKRQ